MRKGDRQDKILEMLKSDKLVKVTFLAKFFDTSELTIRKDLNELYEKGKINRVYGGATLISTFEEPLLERRKKNAAKKSSIGHKARNLIRNGDSIFIDGGTTTECLASALMGFEGVSVITPGLNIISSLQHNPGVTIYIPEGRVDQSSFSIVGTQAESTLKKYNARIAFIGVDGITLAQGLLDNSYEAAAISKIMLQHSQMRVIMADSEKFGNIGTINLCNFNEIDVLVTDAGISDQYKQALEKAGVEVLIAN